MDTKWKNNKKFGLLAAGILIAAVTIVFMALYPSFERKAGVYFKNELHSDQFLRGLLGNNYVLNEMLRSKQSDKDVESQELYLEREIQEMTLEEAEKEIGSDYDYQFDYNEVYRSTVSQLQEYMQQLTNSFQSIYADALDYCVIDKDSGELIKNTGRDIEFLKASETRSQAAEDYVYYIVLSYDSAGNVENVSVKSEYPDDLLKSVQRICDFNLASDRNIFAGYGDKQSTYSYNEAGNGIIKATVTAKNPQNMTVIYALTAQQEKVMMQNSRNNYTMFSGEGETAYIHADVGGVFQTVLLILAMAAFLLPQMKKYQLQHAKIFKIKIELPIILALFLFAQATFSVVSLVNVTNRGYLEQSLSGSLPFLPEGIYPATVTVINFVYLAFIFILWFYCATSLYDITKLGIRRFFRERSLICILCRQLKRKLSAGYDHWKSDMLHADLSGNVKKKIVQLVIINMILLGVISAMWVFGWFVLILYSLILYFMIRKYIGLIQEQYRKLLSMTGAIADGNLHSNMDENLGVFESYKEELYKIQEGFRKAVDEEVKSQKMKTELITNVSHDLKTPLTAITTYIELLKEENITAEQRREYLSVLERKSVRLKLLIEDLFEVSKANSGNVVMNPVEVDICNLMRQTYLEYEDKIEEAELIVRYRMPEEKVILMLDSQKTYRIFENLFSNIIKYAMPRTRVYIEGIKKDQGIRIEMKNISAVELNVTPEELTERFVRGDSSRNTEGSGLGLAIAKSFTELQGGKLTTEVDGDLYKVILEWGS